MRRLATSLAAAQTPRVRPSPGEDYRYTMLRLILILLIILILYYTILYCTILYYSIVYSI